MRNASSWIWKLSCAQEGSSVPSAGNYATGVVLQLLDEFGIYVHEGLVQLVEIRIQSRPRDSLLTQYTLITFAQNDRLRFGTFLGTPAGC